MAAARAASASARPDEPSSTLTTEERAQRTLSVSCRGDVVRVQSADGQFVVELDADTALPLALARAGRHLLLSDHRLEECTASARNETSTTTGETEEAFAPDIPQQQPSREKNSTTRAAEKSLGSQQSSALDKTTRPPVYLDELPLLDVEVGYGELGRKGRLGYEGKRVSVRGTGAASRLSSRPSTMCVTKHLLIRPLKIQARPFSFLKKRERKRVS